MANKTITIKEDTFFNAGKKQGNYFQEELDYFFENIQQLSIVKQIKPNFLPFKPVYNLLKWHAKMSVLKHVKDYAPKNFEYLSGLSESTGKSIADYLLISCANLYLMRSVYYSRRILYPILVPMLPDQGDFCSCVMGFDDDEDPFLFKNLDYMKDLEGSIFIRDLNVDGSYRLISQSFIMMPQVIQGMNEKGLTISLNNGYGLNKPSRGVPISIALTEALYDCKDTESAINFLSQIPIANSGIINIIDQKGVSASIEVSGEIVKVSPKNKGEKFRIYTNFFLTNELKQVDRYKFVSQTKKPSAKDTKWKESADSRFDQIEKFLEKSDGLKIDNLKLLSQYCGGAKTPSPNTVCMDGVNATLASSVYYPTQGKIYLTKGNPLNNKFMEFNYK
ncbi:MAG: C45 family autoproteolytic acyltransferase/hydrolase [Candidatus Dojkabacteria bacterium]